MITQDTSTEFVHGKLQEEARNNPVFRAVCEWLASRQRARKDLGIVPLTIAVKERTGQEPTYDAANQILQFLAGLGFGAVKPIQGRPALTNISTTLQSIGAVALGGSQLDTFKGKPNKTSYRPLKAATARSTPIKPSMRLSPPEERDNVPKTKEIQPSRRGYNVFLTIIVDGNPSVFPGPNNLNSEDLGEFLANFSGLVRSMK